MDLNIVIAMPKKINKSAILAVNKWGIYIMSITPPYMKRSKTLEAPPRIMGIRAEEDGFLTNSAITAIRIIRAIHGIHAKSGRKNNELFIEYLRKGKISPIGRF